jgi:hypothetical protein
VQRADFLLVPLECGQPATMASHSVRLFMMLADNSRQPIHLSELELHGRCFSHARPHVIVNAKRVA